jgi:hypothetical protein
MLRPFLPYDNMRVTVSRPKNLQDILARTALKLPENINIHELIDTAKKDHLQGI